MNKKVILIIGLILFGCYMIIDKFITPIWVWIAVPWLAISVVMILFGGLKPKENKQGVNKKE